MSDITDATDRIRPGQQWTSTGGTVWTVEKRRGRANGFVEVLITSAAGASRWVIESDLREGFTPVPGT